MKHRYIVLCIVNAVSLLLFGIFTAVSEVLARSLSDQLTCERWASGDLQYAQVSVFKDSASAMDINSIYAARVDIDGKLEENSITSDKPGARLWTDAFSTPQTKLTVSSERAEAEANLIATGGDFFLFHPFELISGCYYSSDDVMQDRAVIDDVLAWQLYGSSNVAGMPIKIKGKYFIISGVYRQSKNSNMEKVYGTSPRIFISYEGYGLIGGSGSFTCYEACLPSKVSGQAVQIVKDVLSFKDDDPGIRIIENSARYSLKKRFEIIADFGMRSVVDSAVGYPFWENAARVTEDKSALLLVLQLLFLTVPFCTVMYLFALLYRNKEKLLRKALNAAKNAWYRAGQKRRNKRNSKAMT